MKKTSYNSNVKSTGTRENSWHDYLCKAFDEATKNGTNAADGLVFTPKLPPDETKNTGLCFALVKEEGNPVKRTIIAISKAKKGEKFDLMTWKKVPDACLCLPDVFLVEAFPLGTWGRLYYNGECHLYFKEELLSSKKYRKYHDYFEAIL